MTNQKYEITGIAHKEYPFLHRIRALRDIGTAVKAGDLGGFVEHEGNLPSARYFGREKAVQSVEKKPRQKGAER